jgi:hypothetical protein
MTEQTVRARRPSFRAAPKQSSLAESLGPLRDLPGNWQGPGFSLIATPDTDPGNEDGFYLQLNMIHETIDISPIGSPVQNRGCAQGDISLYGVTYVQKVTDAVSGGALHIEPGLFLRIPATSAPQAEESVARLGTVPHGNAFCIVGEAKEVDVNGTFPIPPACTVPFPTGTARPSPGSPNPYKAYDLSQETPYRTSPLHPEITQELVDNPASFNQRAMEGQTIRHMTVLEMSTQAAGAVANVPFITHNANTVDFDCGFAIEHVVGPDGGEFLQLQYQQTTMLEFRGTSFPHIVAATLVKAF